ncbi:hypothetical protein BDV11DRAFT_216610 [Aspergillus similis]
MPNVLILAALATIGLALSQADITEPRPSENIIAENDIDLVTDIASAYEQASQILQGVIEAATARPDAVADENIVGPTLGSVYCSGSLVYGSHSERVSDLSPVGSACLSKGKAAMAAAWRPAHEQAVLATRDILDVAILRPSTIYGPYITARTGIVHVNDVAAGFHAAIDRIDGRLGGWPGFDLVAETIGIQGIIEGVKAALGVAAEVENTGTHGGAFLEAMNLVSKNDAARTRTVPEWEPKRKNFVLNLPVYVRAWEAAQ